MAAILNITELVRAGRETSQAENRMGNNAKTLHDVPSTWEGVAVGRGRGRTGAQHREHRGQRMSARPDGKALCAALRSGPDAGHRCVVWVSVLQRNKSQKDAHSGVPHSRVLHFTARQRYCIFYKLKVCANHA